jgi:hypothetical protein
VDSFQAAGLKWLGHFFGFLHENSPIIIFEPKPNALVKLSNSSYMYIVVLVDDMAVAMLRPKEFLQLLIDKYKLKLKGTETVSPCLGFKYISDDVTLTADVDAKLIHDWITGHPVKDILHVINVTPINWYSMYQPMVETTYDSELIAACTNVEQVKDLHSMLHHIEVPICGSTLKYGDNKPVVSKLAQPHAKWHKRHTALSSHLVRGAITAGYQQVWQFLQPLLFWQGDTVDIVEDSSSPAKD